MARRQRRRRSGSASSPRLVVRLTLNGQEVTATAEASDERGSGGDGRMFTWYNRPVPGSRFAGHAFHFIGMVLLNGLIAACVFARGIFNAFGGLSNIKRQ
jgi:hypothetical protein